MLLLGLVVVVVLLADSGVGIVGPHDSTALNHSTDTPPSTDDAHRELEASTTIPLTAPPKEVEEQNRDALMEFPRLASDTSLHPPDANRRDGQFLKDAHVSIVAVQPSTRLHADPSRQPLYIGAEGEVLALVDYRVETPPDRSDDGRHISWRVDSHRITETALLVDDGVESSEVGSHTPRLPYSLGDSLGQADELAVEATIEVELTQRIDTCVEYGNETVADHENSTNRIDTPTLTNAMNGSGTTSQITTIPIDDQNSSTAPECVEWEPSIEQESESLTVTDSIAVVGHEIEVDGFIARYPDGEIGILAYKTDPWLGFSVGDESVRGVWRFYVDEDDDWEELVVRTGDGERRIESPGIPQQVHAYPSKPGPTSSDGQQLGLVDVDGTEREPPSLSDDAEVDVVIEPYLESHALVVRTDQGELPTVTATGLVRGVANPDVETSFRDVQLNRSELSLSVVNESNGTAMVAVRLRDEETGAPIDTGTDGGTLVVDGQEIETNASGEATVEVPRSTGAVTARYDPVPWWDGGPGYVSDSDTVVVIGSTLSPLRVAFHLLVPVLTVLFAGVLLARITGWKIWPPWRGL